MGAACAESARRNPVGARRGRDSPHRSGAGAAQPLCGIGSRRRRVRGTPHCGGATERPPPPFPPGPVRGQCLPSPCPCGDQLVPCPLLPSLGRRGLGGGQSCAPPPPHPHAGPQPTVAVRPSSALLHGEVAVGVGGGAQTLPLLGDIRARGGRGYPSSYVYPWHIWGVWDPPTPGINTAVINTAPEIRDSKKSPKDAPPRVPPLSHPTLQEGGTPPELGHPQPCTQSQERPCLWATTTVTLTSTRAGGRQVPAAHG